MPSPGRTRPKRGGRTLGEFGRIARFFAPLSRSFPGAAGLTDDCAVIAFPRGASLVVKTDAIVDTVHLVGDEPADLVARKALRVNLSDLAGKGAEPFAYMLVLATGPRADDAWVRRFARGLGRDQRAFGLALIGGDSGTRAHSTVAPRRDVLQICPRSATKPSEMSIDARTTPASARPSAIRGSGNW